MRRRLREELVRLAGEGFTAFLAGGALGFDTIAAQEVLRVQAGCAPWVRLVLVLPCLGQESQWSQRDAAIYRGLLRQASQVVYTGEAYAKGCMFRRNRFLVDHSARCLCYLREGARGGTAYTVGYARKQGLPVVNLAGLPRENTQLSF